MPTKIEWAEETWNPITGCTPISEGCKNCYAERMSKRLRGRFGYSDTLPFQVTPHWDKERQPSKWRKPRTIFVCSMGDLFHEDVSDHWISRVFSEMWHARRHTFLLLTKRPRRMRDFVNEFVLGTMKHIWFGVTAENQKQWNERVPELMTIESRGKHFVSAEPMLGPINFLLGDIPKPEWVICGGETGPGARPMDVSWARSLLSQCKSIDVPFFFKKTGCGETPEWLNVREWPE